MVRSEIGGQKAKSQIPDLFPDMEFPNLFHLKEHKILMNLKKNILYLFGEPRNQQKRFGQPGSTVNNSLKWSHFYRNVCCLLFCFFLSQCIVLFYNFLRIYETHSHAKF